ncbi:MAG TPA: IS200/IS605 family transposase [Methylomirabilota bacterium]|jgi:putative transposase|nr:IS200/IS605 family transposase [Methylomirabilota bacterium]
MENDYRSLAYSKWDCKYHVIFVPKRRRRQLYGQICRQWGAIFHALARQKECQILEGHVMPDHVHMCIALPPKGAVAQLSGFLKAKSAIAIARQFGGKERNFTGEHFWARGYAVSTVGFELEHVRAYIRKQDDEELDGGWRWPWPRCGCSVSGVWRRTPYR